MSGIGAIRASFQSATQLMQQRDQVVAYLKITEEMGPSAQLLAFIDYDGSLGSNIGIESFNEMSLEDKHTALKTHLSPDKLSALAVESLRDTIAKIDAFLESAEPVEA